MAMQPADHDDNLEFHNSGVESPNLHGEIAGGTKMSASSFSDTLDEPISTTIKRDLFAVGQKFGHALYPKSSQALIRDWDLWGPLFLCVFLALMLHDNTDYIGSSTRRGPQFTDVFVLTFFGACIVTLNIKLLGGTISFFQSVCVLGYCLLAPSIALAICRVVIAVSSESLTAFILRFSITFGGFVWATFASTAFLGNSTPPRRKLLAIYPIGLFYFVVSWLIISHSHYGH